MHRLVWQRAECGDLARQPRQFISRRQRAAPQQMRGFLEADAARQLPQLVAADDQLAGLAVDMAQAGLGGDDAIETPRLGIRAHVRGRRRAARGGEGRQKHDRRDELMGWLRTEPLFRRMAPHKRLVAWQEYHKLVLAVYKVTESFPKHELYGLTSQVRRAAFSCCSQYRRGCIPPGIERVPAFSRHFPRIAR